MKGIGEYCTLPGLSQRLILLARPLINGLRHNGDCRAELGKRHIQSKNHYGSEEFGY